MHSTDLRKSKGEVKKISGLQSEYELKDCPKGQKDSRRGGEVLKVTIHRSDGCNKASICKRRACEYKKKS